MQAATKTNEQEQQNTEIIGRDSSKVDSTCRKNRICDTCDDSIANIAVSGSVSVSAEE